MSIFRDFVAGFEQFDRDATGLRATRVVIGDDGTFQTAKGEIMSDEDTARLRREVNKQVKDFFKSLTPSRTA